MRGSSARGPWPKSACGQQSLVVSAAYHFRDECDADYRGAASGRLQCAYNVTNLDIGPAIPTNHFNCVQTIVKTSLVRGRSVLLPPGGGSGQRRSSGASAPLSFCLDPQEQLREFRSLSSRLRGGKARRKVRAPENALAPATPGWPASVPRRHPRVAPQAKHCRSGRSPECQWGRSR